MTTSPPTTRVRLSVPMLTAIAVIAGLLGAPVSPALAVDTPTNPQTPAVQTAADLPTGPLVKTGSTWKYLDDNTEPVGPTDVLRAWTQPGFDDSEWKTGTSGFGALLGQLLPVGGFTPATKLQQYIEGSQNVDTPTFFFRTTFDLAAGQAARVGSVSGTITHDDAAVIWINGQKVAGFDDGDVSGAVNREYAGEAHTAPETSTFTAAGSVLRDGENTVAVALYQDRETSSDIYFDLSSLTVSPGAQAPTGKDSTAAEVSPEPSPSPAAAFAPERVILNPTATPATSQTFSWLAGDSSQGRGEVEIGEANGGALRTVPAKAVGTANDNPKPHYSVTVDGLHPGTEYRYRVGLPGNTSEWAKFTTASAGAGDFQFLAFGDAQIGLDTVWPKVLRQAEERAPRARASVHVGDLINSANNEGEWSSWFAAMKHSAATRNILTTPGNHEHSGDSRLAAWKANFEYPGTQPTPAKLGELAKLAQGDGAAAKQWAAYFDHWGKVAADSVYTTDYQGVRFISVNSNRNSTFLTPSDLPACLGLDCPALDVSASWLRYEAAWLDTVLKENPGKWSVVTFHHPVYSTSTGRNEPLLREKLIPVLEANNVDLVLMGHDHTYARGFKNTSGTDTKGLRTGPVYSVSNSGGKYYTAAPAGDNVWTQNGATQVVRGEGVTTYQVVDVSNDKLVYRSYLAEKDKTNDTNKQVGDLFDEVTITKFATGEKWVTETGVETPTAPAVRASTQVARTGEKLTVSGTGFVAGSTVKLELHSDPIPLGEAQVGADRSFSAEITIPSGVEAGKHEIVAVSPNGAELRVPLEVRAGDPDSGGGTGPGTGTGTGTTSGTGGTSASGSGGSTGNAGAGAAAESGPSTHSNAVAPGQKEASGAKLARTGGDGGARMAAIAGVLLVGGGAVMLIVRRFLRGGRI